MMVIDNLVKEFGLDVEVTSREYILAHVRGAVIPRNDDILKKGVVFREVLDLALIYKIELSLPNGDKGAYNLSYEVMELAGLSESELFEVVKGYRAYNLKPILETINQLLGGSVDDFDGAFDVPGVFVFTSEDMMYGAAAMVSDVLLEFGKRHDFVVLPCSRHELLLVDSSVNDDINGLKDMVQFVNSTELRPEDYLSDSVYYLDASGLSILA